MDLIEKKMFYNEIKVLKTLDHPHIVWVQEYFETETNIYLVMNLVEGKELLVQILKMKSFGDK